MSLSFPFLCLHCSIRSKIDEWKFKQIFDSKHERNDTVEVQRRLSAAVLLPRLLGNSIPGHTTRAQPCKCNQRKGRVRTGDQQQCYSIQFYVFTNLAMTSLTLILQFSAEFEFSISEDEMFRILLRFRQHHCVSTGHGASDISR